jgi:phosphoribosylamine--glycine ligase
VKVFHAGSRLDGDDVVTNGGRVLCVVGLGDDVSSAQRVAYRAVEKLDWHGVYCRGDIGYRAVARELA